MIIKKKNINTQGAEVQQEQELSTQQEEESVQEVVQKVEPEEEEIDLFDLDNIDFKQRKKRNLSEKLQQRKAIRRA